MSNLDQFEKLIKSNLEDQQYSYDASQWGALEKQLPSSNKGYVWKTIAGAAVVAVAGLVIDNCILHSIRRHQRYDCG